MKSMDPSGYPRLDNTPSGPYPKDSGMGIAVIVCAILGVFCGLAVGLGGTLFGLFGAAAASTSGRESEGMAAFFGLGGSLIAIFGFGIMACSAVQVAGGVGIMRSRRWGFVLTAVLSVVSLLLSLPAIPSGGVGVLGVIQSAVFLWYSWMRLSGREGPTPV